MDLPRFKYHPDPLSTGSVEKAEGVCSSCGRARGYIYRGPVYAIETLNDCICPWCIADGAAHRKFDAAFVDAAGVGGYGSWEAVPGSVIEEVVFRTPGFSGWQQERWWTHCGDAAEFLGPVGRKDAERAGPEFLAAIRAEAGLDDEQEWAEFMASLNRDHGPTAYMFRCGVCGQMGGYSDYT